MSVDRTVHYGSSLVFVLVFFFKQKTAYEMRISDWSSDVCSSDILLRIALGHVAADEEMLLFGFRPDAGPVQRHHVAVTMHVVAVEIAHQPAASRQPHFVAGFLQVVGMDEPDETGSAHV